MVLGPVRGQFDYLPPNPLPSWPLVPGLRVKVPFGAQSLVGIIRQVREKTECPPNKLKPIDTVLDEAPLFPPSLFELGLWLHRYYHCPLGEVWNLLLPKALRQGKADAWPNEKRRRKGDWENIDPGSLPEQALTLNPAQASSVQTLQQAQDQFQVFLLEGVTGSGKTEVYLQTMASVLQAQKQVLIIVPEIALTPQTVARFQARFPVPIAVYHSGLTDAQRLHAWKMAGEGLAPIVIGTRSAVFLPLKQPGLFIVDEEHDMSFKQQEGIRYSARDTLIRRAQLEQVPIILGSATPSLETVHNAQQGKYQHLRLPERAGAAVHPTMTIIDTRQMKAKSGLSAPLIQKIKQHLVQQGQVLLFLNRRGFARLLMCTACAWQASCQRCDAHLIYHHKKQQLRCHHCLAETAYPKQCPQCGVQPLTPLGVGTEKVEQALNDTFSQYPILRLDRDLIQHKEALDDALNEINTGKPLILLGTQMISKGHHFKKVTLVGILDCDGAFFSADFRSQERLGQLLTQVAGRAGRESDPGEVLLQTHFPDHPLLRQLLHSGYAHFAKSLLEERQLMGLPPYAYQVLWRAESKRPQIALQFLENLREKLRGFAQSIQALGPVPCTMEKRAGFFRAQLLMQSSDRRQLHEQTHYLIHQLTQLKSTPVRWTVDVDPLELT